MITGIVILAVVAVALEIVIRWAKPLEPNERLERLRALEDPDMTDPDNPEMTAEEFARAVPVIDGDWDTAMAEAERKYHEQLRQNERKRTW